MGTGLCECLTSLACVSGFQQSRTFGAEAPSQTRHIWTRLNFRAVVKRYYGALLRPTADNVLTLQFMIIENTGKKVVILRGYAGMSVVLILLTITIYFQVSCSQSAQQLLPMSDASQLLKSLLFL